MKRKLRVLLDVDGVLTTGFLDYACELLRERGFSEAYPGNVSQWDFMAQFGIPRYVEEEVNAILAQPGTHDRFQPAGHAVLSKSRETNRILNVAAGPRISSSVVMFRRTNSVRRRRCGSYCAVMVGSLTVGPDRGGMYGAHQSRFVDAARHPVLEGRAQTKTSTLTDRKSDS